MKAHPAIGDFYRQEFSLNNAEDFAETLSLNEVLIVYAGTQSSPEIRRNATMDFVCSSLRETFELRENWNFWK